MYRLGTGSRRELQGVHPALVRVVERAIQITLQDFSVHDGIRTIEEQRQYVKAKVSWTMKSRHLPQADGYGHEVDLVPYINGRLRWEWPPIYAIARAMRQAAEELGVKIVWGGCWERLDGDMRDPELMVEQYSERRRRKGKKVRADGPHFQLAG